MATNDVRVRCPGSQSRLRGRWQGRTIVCAMSGMSVTLVYDRPVVHYAPAPLHLEVEDRHHDRR